MRLTVLFQRLHDKNVTSHSNVRCYIEDAFARAAWEFTTSTWRCKEHAIRTTFSTCSMMNIGEMPCATDHDPEASDIVPDVYSLSKYGTLKPY
jgi:hypothetical protein